MTTARILASWLLVLALAGSALAQLPSGWRNADVGAPWPPGSASYNESTGLWAVTGDGRDIWEKADDFHYAYRRLRGDGRITARVVSIRGANLHEWAKAGVMIREDLTRESKHAMMVMTPGSAQNHAASLQWRPTTGGVSYSDHSGTMGLPYWVSMERSGNTFKAYISPDGSTWTQQGTAQTISMSETVYIGLAVLSHQHGVLCTAKFDGTMVQGETAMPTAFTYQGRLLDGAAVADGLYDFQFKLFDDPDVAIGGQLGSTAATGNVDVIDGYFTVQLDFGLQVFDGSDRWLEISVRPGASTGTYTVLEPRQELTPAPYAIYAERAGEAIRGAGGGDNFGNHTATENVRLDGNWVSGDGENEGVYVAENGNVGIGKIPLVFQLEVAGHISATKGVSGLHSTEYHKGELGNAAGGVFGEAGTGSTNYGVLGCYEAGVVGVGTPAGYFNGNVGIGVTSPAYKLDVDGAANLNKGKTGAALFVDGKEALWYEDTCFSWGYGGDLNYFFDPVAIGSANPAGYKLAVYGDAAKTGTASWSTISDERVKELNGTYERGLSEIDGLTPVRYCYKGDTELELPTDREYVGVVAQQVQSVIPEAVEENSDGYLMVNNDPIIWAMVNAIKELKDENDALKQRHEEEISDLTARLERMEAMIQISNKSFERVRR